MGRLERRAKGQAARKELLIWMLKRRGLKNTDPSEKK
jgi:hypothetical protein